MEVYFIYCPIMKGYLKNTPLCAFVLDVTPYTGRAKMYKRKSYALEVAETRAGLGVRVAVSQISSSMGGHGGSNKQYKKYNKINLPRSTKPSIQILLNGNWLGGSKTATHLIKQGFPRLNSELHVYNYDNTTGIIGKLLRKEIIKEKMYNSYK